MANETTYHIRPESGGSWAVKGEDSGQETTFHATRSEAIAHAVEALMGRDESRVIVHEPDGRIRSSLTIRNEAEDEAAIMARAQAKTPGIATLLKMAENPSCEGADLDADPADLY